jgi:predicted DCC family thiol-disulfide oxidoreductase YuxK
MSDAVLVYDDDCGFCTWWAELFAERSSMRIVGFSDLDDHPALRERLPESYEDCAHLVTDDRVYSCGASIEEAFVRSSLGRPARPLVRFLRQFGDYERLRERGYRAAADRRDLLGTLVSRPPPARQSGERDRDRERE